MDAATSKGLVELFPYTDYLEKQQFSRLHKIVLGPVPTHLEEGLALSTTTINVVDSSGKAPLTWAAARGDVHATRTLLKNNANPNTKCTYGNTPLQLAAKAANPAVIIPLLEANAHIDQKNNWGLTALYYATIYHDSEAHMIPLLKARINVNAKNKSGWSALMITTQLDRWKSARLLFDYGADFESRDDSGWTPLLRSVEWNSHNVLKALLSWHADLTARTQKGETILHIAASKADRETIEILTGAGVRGVDASALDHGGCTASELMKRRTDVDPETLLALEHLFETIDIPDRPDIQETEEVFVDARMYQSFG